MKTSLIIPTYNEEKSIKRLMESVFNQTVLPDEIIIVDSKSKDKTIDIIKSFKSKKIKIISKKTNISEARNLAIKNSKHSYILATDGGCVLDKKWVESMKKAFNNGKVDYVMGNFKPIKSKGLIKNAIGLVSLQSEKRLGRDPYLASTRSIGFKKEVWKKTKGFPENLYTGEDTKFNLKVKEMGFKAFFAKNAIVYWEPRTSLKRFLKQFYLYGKGDGKSRNIVKIKDRLLVFLTYLTFHLLFLLGILLYMPLFWASLGGYIIINFIDSWRYLRRIENPLYKSLNIVPVMFFIYLKRVSYSFGALIGIFKNETRLAKKKNKKNSTRD